MASHKQVEKKKLAYNTSEIKNNHGNKVNELCPYLLGFFFFFWKLSHFEKLHIKIYIYIYLNVFSKSALSKWDIKLALKSKRR